MGMAEPTTAIRVEQQQGDVIEHTTTLPLTQLVIVEIAEAAVGDSVVDMMAGTAAEAEMEEEEASGAVVEEDAEEDSVVVVVGEEDAEVTLEEVGEDVIRLTTERERG